MPVSKKRSKRTNKKSRGVTPPTTGNAVKKPGEAVKGKPKRKIRRGVLGRFKTFRAASDFRCERCGSSVAKDEYIGTVKDGVSYMKVCETCKWKVYDKSSELIGEDTRRPWVRALHSILRIPMIALYAMGGFFVLLVVFSIIQLLIFGSH